MLINLKCDTCKEPSKYVTGFYDGKKGKHGVLYDCKNELCEVNQLMRAAEAEDIQKRLEIQDMDSQRGISAAYVAAKRQGAGLTMYQMSRIGGCSPAEYSSYEHERKPFDPEVYRKCINYLKEIRNTERKEKLF